MRFHIVRSCRPLSRFMVSVALRCHYLETLLLTLWPHSSQWRRWTRRHEQRSPFWSFHSLPPACVLQGWPLKSSGSLRCNIYLIPCRGLCTLFLFSYLLRWWFFTRHWLTVRISLNAALIPKRVHTLSIPSLRPLTYGRLYVRRRGVPRESEVAVWASSSPGLKGNHWPGRRLWGAEVQLSWRWSHRCGWLCLTYTLTSL